VGCARGKTSGVTTEVVDGIGFSDESQYGRAERAVDGTLGIVHRPLPSPTRVIVRGTVFVVAAEDVRKNWHGTAFPDGSIGGRKPGARGRRGIKTIPGARWLDAAKKGGIGRLHLGGPRRFRKRKARP
jgi:hypothetical protein